MTFRIISLISLSFVILIFTIDGGPPVVQAHGHSHDEKPAAYKYSRAANEVQEDEILEEDIIDLPPQRGPSQGHGHSHGGHGHSHGGHGHSHGTVQPELTPEQREKARKNLHKNWDDDDEEETGTGSVHWNAILATLLISAAPFFILFFIPLDNSAENQWLLKITLAFASGGLLGDAFLHLIPHAMMASSGDESDSGHGHSHSHGHSHGDGEAHGPHDLSVGLWTLAGIIAFLCVEKLVRIYSGGHSHSHAAPAVVPAEEKKVVKKEEKKEEKEQKKEEKEETKEEKKADDKKEKEDKPTEPKTEENAAALPEEKEIKVAGYLNLAADAFHNFTDGLAIGASFMAGNAVGFTTTFSILFHEIPHEIGDYAILIQSGVPPMKAILLQSLTALAALAGCLVALFAHGAGQAAAAGIILPFTAGGFIYIATVSVIPELLEGTSLMQSIYEIVALLAGVGMMVIISWFE